jgi:uncharacterized glyoxalase superfamily protein PhnB
MHGDDFAEIFPLIWTNDVAAIADWAVATLGLKESWRAPGEDGQIEHAELHWFAGKVSINIDKGMGMGPSGISLRVDNPKVVDEIYERARTSGATINQGPEKSLVAYSFTAVDQDGNQWWVNAETGFLDELRHNDA